MGNKLFYIILISIFSIGLTHAQTPELKLKTSSQNVQVGQRIKVIYQANKNCQIDVPNSFDGMQIISGPSSSKSQSIRITNGKMKRELKVSKILYLKAEKKGRFTIPKANMSCEGEKYTSNKLTINVTEGGQASAQNTSNSDFFATIQSNKSKVYVGEPFSVTFNIYSKYPLRSINEINVGDFKNIWHKNLNPNNQIQQKRKVINGRRLYSSEVKKEVCIANNVGQAEVSAFDAEILVRYGFMRTATKTVNSNSLSVDVQPFPEGAPKNFQGAVGNFSLDAEVSKNALKTGEGMDLKIELSGQGNLHLLEDFQPEIPSSFDMFEPDIQESLEYNFSGSDGKIDYSYLMTPTQEGDYVLGPIEISYFNPKTETYTSLKTDSFDIKVAKGSGTYNPYTTLKNTVDTVKTFRYIKTGQPEMFTIKNYWAATEWFYGLLALIPISMGLGYWSQKRRNTEKVQYKKSRQGKANKFAIKSLKHAKSLLDASEFAGFHEALTKALYQYIQDKFNLNPSALDKSKIKATLTNHNVDDETINRFIEIIETSEMARFAQVEDLESQKIYESAVANIGDIQNQCKG